MIGIMIPSGFAEESTLHYASNSIIQKNMPSWIKNIAELWSQDKITDDEFLNSINYLAESNIIKGIQYVKYDSLENEINSEKKTQWYFSASEALQNPIPDVLNLPHIEGKTDNYTSKIPVEVTVIDPNGQTQISTDITRNGKYSVTPNYHNITISGMYVIEIRVDEKLVNKQYAFLDKNESDIQNVVSNESKKVIPHWIKNSATWWVENKITEKDFLQGIKFLVKTNVILSKDSLNSLTGEMWMKKLLQTDVNSNLLSNSNTIDISKYKDNPECRTELKKINKLTIQTMKECDKIISNSHVKTPKIDDTFKRIIESRAHKPGNQPSNIGQDPFDYENRVYWQTKEINNNLEKIGNYTSPQHCMIESKADDGIISASEKSLCDQVNRTWATDDTILDNYGNKIGDNYRGYVSSDSYDYGSYYYGGYDYSFNMDAEVQYALNRADIYANQALSEMDKYANQWASGQISYGEYERKAMASMDNYSNQYASEMTSYWDSKYGYYP